MDNMNEAMGSFMANSRAYIIVGPRDDDGYIGVRFSGSQNDLRCMFQEIGTHLYQAMVISEEQWRTVCLEDQGCHH